MRVTVTQELKDFLRNHGESSLCNLNKIDVDILFKVYSKLVTKSSENEDVDVEKRNKNNLPSLQELLINSKRDFSDNSNSIHDNSNTPIMEILRRRSEERKYQSSIKNLSQAKYTSKTNDVPDAFGVYYSRDVLLSLNALIGLILTFVGGFYAPVYVGIPDLNTRVFIGIGCSLICLIAEVSLFMIYDVKRNIQVSKKIKEDPVYRFLERTKVKNIEKADKTKEANSSNTKHNEKARCKKMKKNKQKQE